MQHSCEGVTYLPSPPLVVLGRGCFGNMNGLLECSSQVNGALLDHLPDVFDPVLLVLDARRLLRVNSGTSLTSQKLDMSGNDLPLEFLFHSVCLTQV